MDNDDRDYDDREVFRSEMWTGAVESFYSTRT